MKRKTAVFLCIVMIASCVLLGACGGKQDLSNSKYVGTWKAESISAFGEESSLEGDWILTLNADGTATLEDGEEVSKCTWQETSDGFKLKGDAKMTFTDDGDGIKSKVIGVELHFTRQ